MASPRTGGQTRPIWSQLPSVVSKRKANKQGCFQLAMSGTDVYIEFTLHVAMWLRYPVCARAVHGSLSVVSRSPPPVSLKPPEFATTRVTITSLAGYLSLSSRKTYWVKDCPSILYMVMRMLSDHSRKKNDAIKKDMLQLSSTKAVL
jgi:hypothetical protein